uniref:Uncharacterized protein n=1 Tax=Siphoviridae sp. ct4sp3 TaxID=2825332 RepID=A0A8S5PU59_9CAUD|nr:MAG TPA: hypothetical protein [Siphoviridae sp. ct4sp3]
MWRLIGVRKNEKRPLYGDLFEWDPDAKAVTALPVGNRVNFLSRIRDNICSIPYRG